MRRVEIPKPNGGVRNLGIPSVVDRIIEQAIAQRLTPIVEPLFSDYSYGFRPKRRAQQAVIKLLEYLNDGYTYIVDIDLEKFFDNVPQDKLLYLVHGIIDDGDTESLIHKYLKYLGFGFWKDSKDGQWKASPHQDSVARFKRKLKNLTDRSWSISMDDRIEKLNAVIRGWINYYRLLG